MRILDQLQQSRSFVSTLATKSRSTQKTRSSRPQSVQRTWPVEACPDWAGSSLEAKVLHGGSRRRASPGPSYNGLQQSIAEIEALKKELQLRSFPKYKPTPKAVQRVRQQLRDMRTLTVAILRSIYQREELKKSLEYGEVS